MSYLGSKAGAGVAEQIISQMPQHEVYVEAFAGHAAILRKKLPTASSFAIDLDPDVCRWLRRSALARNGEAAGVRVICDDAVLWLERHVETVTTEWLVYADPPYLRSTRTSRHRYACEFDTPQEHARLLAVLKRLPCHVMVSGYDSPLYRRELGAWRVHQFGTSTRGTRRIECVWMNFAADVPLHDTRFVGDGFRERERIRRKRARWVKRLASMPPAERQVIVSALAEVAAAGLGAADEASTGNSCNVRANAGRLARTLAAQNLRSLAEKTSFTRQA